MNASGDPNGCLSTCPLMRPTMRAYSHQGHGPQADQTGRMYIRDFRNTRTISIAKRSRSIHPGHKRLSNVSRYLVRFRPVS
jgi:hypothetical protein